MKKLIKNTHFKKTFSALPFLLGSTLVHAQAPIGSEIALGVPVMGGSGCPTGTASVSISPDAKSLSILFDQYAVEAGGRSGKTLDRKSCNISVPVQIPHGYSVSIFQVDYRGFASLPYGSRAQFNVEYFFAGSRGPIGNRSLFGPAQGDFTLTDSIAAEAVVWSACGADVNLRANTSAVVQTNAYGEQANLSIDSADVSAGIVYRLQWRRCGEIPAPFPGGGGGGGFPVPQPQPIPPQPPVPMPQPPRPRPVPPPPRPRGPVQPQPVSNQIVEGSRVNVPKFDAPSGIILRDLGYGQYHFKADANGKIYTVLNTEISGYTFTTEYGQTLTIGQQVVVPKFHAPHGILVALNIDGSLSWRSLANKKIYVIDPSEIAMGY